MRECVGWLRTCAGRKQGNLHHCWNFDFGGRGERDDVDFSFSLASMAASSIFSDAIIQAQQHTKTGNDKPAAKLSCLFQQEGVVARGVAAKIAGGRG